MKKFAAVFAAVVCCAGFSGCGNTAEKPANADAEAAAAAVVSTAAEQLPREEFNKLPEGEEDRINDIAAAVGEVFPEVSGRRMYAFKGMEQILDGGAEESCYVFDFYTYKKKKDEYTKIATVAQSAVSGKLLVYDEQTGEYMLPVVVDEP